MYDCLPLTPPPPLLLCYQRTARGLVLVRLCILYYDAFDMQRENVEKICLYSARVSIIYVCVTDNGWV